MKVEEFVENLNDFIFNFADSWKRLERRDPDTPTELEPAQWFELLLDALEEINWQL